MTGHSTENHSFCLYLRANADLQSVFELCCWWKARLHIIRHSEFRVFPVCLRITRKAITTEYTEAHREKPASEGALADWNCISRENACALP